MPQGKTGSWKLLHSLWLALLFVPFFNWVAFLYAGSSAKVRKWTLFSAFYALPVFGMFTIVPFYVVPPDWFVISLMGLWLASIIHGFSIRDTYLKTLAENSLGAQDAMPANPAPTQRRQGRRDAHQDFLDKLYLIRDEIDREIQLHRQHNPDLDELKPMLAEYMSVAENLVDRDRQFISALRQNDIPQLESQIAQVRQLAQSTTDPELKRQYIENLSGMDELKKGTEKLKQQREINRVRLNNIGLSLKDLKLKLLKLDSISQQMEGRRVQEEFQQKTKDLSAYVSSLKSLYDEFG